LRVGMLCLMCVIGTWKYFLLMPLVATLPSGDTPGYLSNFLLWLFDKYMYKRYVRVVYTRGGDQEERFDLIIGTGGAFCSDSASHRLSSSASSRRLASVAFISTAAFRARRYRRRGLSFQSIYFSWPSLRAALDPVTIQI